MWVGHTFRIDPTDATGHEIEHEIGFTKNIQYLFGHLV